MTAKITPEKISATIARFEREGLMPKYTAITRQKRGTKYFYTLQAQRQAIQNGFPGSIYLGDSESEKYKHWMEVKQRTDAVRKLRRALRFIGTDPERATAEIKGIALVNPMGDSDASVEWYTPVEFIEMARQVLGGIDLDPASNPTAQQWIKASRYYTKDDDGLLQPWFGRVWCNPPYGKMSKPFLQRGVDLYKDGAIDSAIFLLNRTGAAWYVDLLEQCTSVCQVRTRIAFIDANGTKQTSARYYNDFIYLGLDRELFKEVFSTVGKVMVSD